MAEGRGLHEMEKCVIQILTAKGLLEDRVLMDYLHRLEDDYRKRDPSYMRPSKEDMFRRINDAICDYSLEIKSIIDRDEENMNIFYHGLVNTEEDYVAKTFGASGLDNTEILFFTDLVTKLVQAGRFSTRDIENQVNKPKNWSNSDVGVVLGKLEDRKWLRRDERGYWILGLRTYLELRIFLEGVMNDEDRAGSVADFPQLIVY
jgi:hypothetical protein